MKMNQGREVALGWEVGFFRVAVKDLKWVGERSSLGFELKSNKKKKWERREDCCVLNHFKSPMKLQMIFF